MPLIMEQILHYTLVFLTQVQPVVVTHFQPYQQDISTIANQQVHTKIQMEQAEPSLSTFCLF